MKKLFIIMFALFLTSAYAEVMAVEKSSNCPPLPPPGAEKRAEMHAQREAAFEKRLGLTEEQKVKARAIRMKSHEKLKPVIEEIHSKRQEAEMVKLSRMAVQAQEEKLTEIDNELKILEKKAHEIRVENMKEFESILTKKQKKTLKEMKQEGRKKYHQCHPVPHKK